MNDEHLVMRAVRAALFQRQHGDRRPLRHLFLASFSLLRYLHHQVHIDGGPIG